MHWLPIDTAPQDGSEFIGYSLGGRWHGQEGKWVAYVCHRDRNLWIAIGEGVVNPTHWMPLPDPPTADEGKPKGEK